MRMYEWRSVLGLFYDVARAQRIFPFTLFDFFVFVFVPMFCGGGLVLPGVGAAEQDYQRGPRHCEGDALLPVEGGVSHEQAQDAFARAGKPPFFCYFSCWQMGYRLGRAHSRPTCGLDA